MAIFCEKCGDSGFAGNGTSYGDVCDECGGQSAAALDDPKLLGEKCNSLRAELSAARRAGKAEGKDEAFKEAALVAREVAAAPGRYEDMPEKIAAALIARAEEVERE